MSLFDAQSSRVRTDYIKGRNVIRNTVVINLYNRSRNINLQKFFHKCDVLSSISFQKIQDCFRKKNKGQIGVISR